MTIRINCVSNNWTIHSMQLWLAAWLINMTDTRYDHYSTCLALNSFNTQCIMTHQLLYACIRSTHHMQWLITHKWLMHSKASWCDSLACQREKGWLNKKTTHFPRPYQHNNSSYYSRSLIRAIIQHYCSRQLIRTIIQEHCSRHLIGTLIKTAYPHTVHDRSSKQ